MTALLATMEQYGFLLQPWAASVANGMLADVNRRTARSWKKLSLDIGQEIRGELASSPNGAVYRELQREQVELITSLPTKAGRRVQLLTEEALVTGRRAESISKEIMRSGEVTQARARLIARTEVAKASSNFIQARALGAGSEGYIWRTSDDADVRDTHKAMEGRYVRWDSPPKTDPSLDPYHAGCGPNCRCYPEPVFPEL
ncbi:Phage Mu protein F like protein [compost metagenome]